MAAEGPRFARAAKTRPGHPDPKYLIRLGASYMKFCVPRGTLAYMNNGTQEREHFESLWLPRAPLASKYKAGGYRRRSRARALGMPYIEANPTCLQSLIITDHDGGDADQLPDRLGLPRPTYTALNPHTRSGHIVYGLGAPVCLTDAASRRPVNLLARIEAGLVDVLGGDTSYGGRITKNPCSEQHLPLWGPNTAVYGLRELAGALDDLGALPRYDRDRTQLVRSAVGRNVGLFDLTRQWAYRRRGDYKCADEWEEVVYAYAWDRNQTVIGEEFTRGPMGEVEVKHLARSISRWTWRNITRTFEDEQRRRGRRGGQVMTEKKREANRVRATKFDHAAMLEAAR